MNSKQTSIRMVSVISLGLMCAGAAAGQSTTAPNETATNPGAADKHFIQKAMEGGMAEVQLGQLASQKASADDVKQFGQKMVDDHTKLNDQMKPLAAKDGVTPPTQLSPKDQALATKLEGLSGDQFDKAYIQAMVQDHKKDLHEFKKEAATTQDPGLKAAVSQGQTVIHGHLEMVEQLAKTHNVSTGNAKMAGQ